MTVKEVMERVPTTNSGYAMAYIDDALKEIQLLIEDNMVVGTLDLVKDTNGLSVGTPDTLAMQRCHKNLEFFGIRSADPARAS